MTTTTTQAFPTMPSGVRLAVVGLGYVHRDFTASSTEVTVMWNDSRIKAVVQ